MLKPINRKELIFSGDIEDDRVNTFVKLDDYDWMNYKINTRFHTKDQGILDVEFEYFGTTDSHMKVVQKLKGKEETFTYAYNTDIFEKYITRFLRAHIRAWKSKYAFNGEKWVVEFFNEVVTTGMLV